MAPMPPLPPEVPKNVIDAKGRRWTLRGRLGRGGQGQVFATSDARHAVKLFDASGPHEVERLRRQLAFVRSLDLAGTHVARPLELIASPRAGYVMEFLDGMEPLSQLGDPPRSGVMDWYVRGGGLRRRLRLLAHAGETLATVHGKGLAYGDVSASNVFVSQLVTAHEAWMIDADNLAYAGRARPLYTPGFGAPELLSGRDEPSSLTDAHAFAVLVFRTLALAHPFVGDAVHEGPPELEEKAMRGELPFVDAANDTTNRTKLGFARETLLSDRLRELAEETFQAGRLEPLKRPGIARWVEALHEAADRCITCSECRSSYLPSARRLCPFCGAAQAEVFAIQTRLWDPRFVNADGANGLVPDAGISKSDRLPRLFLTAGARAALSRRFTDETTGIAGREVVAHVSCDATRCLVRFVEHRPAQIERIDASGGLRCQPLQGNEVHMGIAWSLHLSGPERDKQHRVLRYVRVSK